MAIAQSKIGNDKVAEDYYLKAIMHGPNNPECYYFYGLFLVQKNRIDEARKILNEGLRISPDHEGINILLGSLKNNFQSILDIARNTAAQNPTPDNYLNLSLQLYNAGLFSESADAAKEAVKIKPDYELGYNNICAAYNKIGEFDSAVVAGQKAVQLNPNDQLAKNNLAAAQNSKLHFDKLESDARKKPEYNAWINLSLEWYNASNFKKSMIAAQEATLLNPDDATGWNNVCAAANKTGDWDRAIVAGEKALKLAKTPEMKAMATNNLAAAREGKKNSGSIKQ
jgi:tetratricopeptide (TPR) repeat protein